ncbi:SDR family oxidoreductase [Gordonia sp. ABSL1-1]|uniref:SDR family oxidoreductase n=1 Tax=Gordonia sp. ABSL1-1 TaxID=3053923 RepID=UPI00257421EB|nr:SDR family oxidoreductase [Gordonia sp. ABSL1-1]MDL9936461.1 SDR family oxidoreductase [Gordonia sp. ABSL1-1]
MGEKLNEGRVAIVTGAGQGIGRSHALAFAADGAKVVVNDYAADSANAVVEEITAAGGQAVAAVGDVADWADGGALVQTALDTFGGLDILVNNAGFVRDRMLLSLGEDEWDSVVRVHLKGHFVTLRHAGAYWRGEAKAGRARQARIVNTSSGAGLFGSVGQGNYVAAKAGILGLTIQAAAELGGYGVTVNAIAPAARTQMTMGAGGEMAEQMAAPADGSFDAMNPANISPLVVWLASPGAGEVNGRVFEVEGGRITALDGWQRSAEQDKGARWEPAEVGAAVADILAKTPAPVPVYGAR